MTSSLSVWSSLSSLLPLLLRVKTNIPLFAHGTPGKVGIYLILFLFLVGVWCLLGYTISHLPGIAQVLERTGSFLLPFLLIGLGLFILSKNGTFLMLFHLVTHH